MLEESCWREVRKKNQIQWGLTPFRAGGFPKDLGVLKILRVVNLLRVVFLLAPCDLLSRRTLCGHHIFLGIRDIFPLREGSAS